ncbi:MAG: hypothetical protein H3C31_13050 [Brumimicrobium sp.]|nr:hypothetical protein [Brumimicrobium sp.]
MTNQISLTHFILIALLMFSYSSAFSQNAMTMLKFEEAEKAFNKGNYTETLNRLDEVESATGVTSKTLYLRIVSQNQLWKNNLVNDTHLYEELKNNVNTYLNALKNEAIDDKFRLVYQINENIINYSPSSISTEEQIQDFTANIMDDKVREVFQNYWKAVLGKVNPARIQTTQIEIEYFKNNEQTPSTKRLFVKDLDKLYSKSEVSRVPKYPNYTFISEDKYVNGKGIRIISVISQPNGTPIEQTQKKEEPRVMGIAPVKRTTSPSSNQPSPSIDQEKQERVLTSEEIDLYSNSTKGGLSFLDARCAFMPIFFEKDAPSAQFEKGEFSGKPVAVVKIKNEEKVGMDTKTIVHYLYFSLDNHLLLADKTITEFGPAYNEALLVYEDYRNEKGLLLSFTRKNQYKYAHIKEKEKWSINYEAASKKQKREMDETLSNAKHILNPKSNTDEILISKIKSIIFNEDLPDELFK